VTVTESFEGLESAVMALSGGTISVVASDDGVNVAGGPGVESGGGQMGGMGAGGGAVDGLVPGDRPDRSDRPADGMPASVDGGDVVDGAADGRQGAGAPGAGVPGAGATDGRSLVISGGTLIISAGADGLDANADVTMTGGTVVTTSAKAGGGDSAVDVDGAFTIEGGNLVATGLTDQTATPTTAGQGLVNVGLGDQTLAQNRVTVTDASGNVVVSYVTEKAMSSLVISTEGLVAGDTYTVTTGGSLSGGDTVGSATFGGTTVGSEELGTVTAA
jgi:hypothetical protein